MKKLIWTGLAGLLVLSVMTCEMPLFSGGADVLGYTDFALSSDGRSLTLYLDGTLVPETKASRALSTNLARTGHDYFEVVFYDGATVARSSWEIGGQAGIRNVPRDADGVDYSDISATPVPLDIGHAMLFVGRKSDKTLLAVGTIASTVTDGVVVNDALITTKTTRVTFEVTAFDAKMPAAGTTLAAATDTFLTGGISSGSPTAVSASDTKIDTATAGSESFPIFLLEADAPQIFAEYAIGPSAISGYLPGIRVNAANTSEAGEALIKIPRFSIGGGNYMELSAPHALDTSVELYEVTTHGEALTNPITMTITTGTMQGLCSLSFEIPVFAVTDAIQPGVDNAIVWYIRHGYGTYRFDLDSGVPGAAGGSILLGVGDDITLNYIEINVVGP